MEGKLLALLSRSTAHYVVALSILVGILAYGIATAASLALAIYTLATPPLGEQAVIAKGSLMPFTGIVPLSISQALDSLGIANEPVYTALALVDYRYVVYLVGVGWVNGSVCYEGGLVGLRPGMHMLTSYIRSISVPILLEKAPKYGPYVVCGADLVEAFSNGGGGLVNMVLIPNSKWGIVTRLLKQGINFTVVNELNETVDLYYSYIGVGYIMKLGSARPGMNEFRLSLNSYMIYGYINNSLIPLGTIPNRTVLTIPKSIGTGRLPTGNCSIAVTAPQGVMLAIYGPAGYVTMTMSRPFIRLLVPCGKYTIMAYEGGLYTLRAINVSGSANITLTLPQYSSELTGAESKTGGYFPGVFRGIGYVYAALASLTLVSMGMVVAGLIGLSSMVNRLVYRLRPIYSSLSILSSKEYANRIIAHYSLILLALETTISLATYLLTSLNANTILVLRIPMEWVPYIGLVILYAASTVVAVTIKVKSI